MWVGRVGRVGVVGRRCVLPPKLNSTFTTDKKRGYVEELRVRRRCLLTTTSLLNNILIYIEHSTKIEKLNLNKFISAK